MRLNQTLLILLLALTTLLLLLTPTYSTPILDIRAIPIGDGFPNAYIDGYYTCDRDDCYEAILSAQFDSWITAGFAPSSYSISIFDPTQTLSTYATLRGTFKRGEEKLSNVRVRFPQQNNNAQDADGTIATIITLWRFVIHLNFNSDSLPRADIKPVQISMQMGNNSETVSDVTWFVFVPRGIVGSSVGVLYRIRDPNHDSGLVHNGDMKDHFKMLNSNQEEKENGEIINHSNNQFLNDSLDIQQDDQTPDGDQPTPEPPIDDDDEDTWYNYSITSDGIYRTNFISKDYSTSQSSSVHVTTMAIPTDEFRIRMEKVTHDVKRILISPFGSFAFWGNATKDKLKCTLNGENMTLRPILVYPSTSESFNVQNQDNQDNEQNHHQNTSSIQTIIYNQDLDMDIDSPFNNGNRNSAGYTTIDESQQYEELFQEDNEQKLKMSIQQDHQQKIGAKQRYLFSLIAEFDEYLNSTSKSFITKNSDMVLHCRNMTVVNENIPHGILVNLIGPEVPRSEFYFAPQYTTAHFSTSYTLTSPQYSSLIHPEHVESTSSGPIIVDHNKKRESQYVWLSQHRHIYKLHNAMIPVTGDATDWFMNVTLSNMNGYRLHNQYPYIRYYFGVPTQARTSSTCFPQHAIYQRLQEQQQHGSTTPTGKFPQIKSPMFGVSRQIDTTQGAFLIVEYQLEMVNGWKETNAPSTQQYAPPTFKLSIAQTNPLERTETSRNNDETVDGMQIFSIEMVHQGDDMITERSKSSNNHAKSQMMNSLDASNNDNGDELQANRYFYIDEISSLSHFTRLSRSLHSLECAIDKLATEENEKYNIENNVKDGDANEKEFSLLSTFGLDPSSSSPFVPSLSSIYNTLATTIGLEEINNRPKKYINLDHYYLNALKSLPDHDEFFPSPITSWSNIRTTPDSNTKLTYQYQFNTQQTQNVDIMTLNNDQKIALQNLKKTFQSYSFNITMSDLMIEVDVVGKAITSALIDISTERFLFVLSKDTGSDTAKASECSLLNHSTHHTSPTIAKSTRNELDIDQHEATSLFFRFTEELKPQTTYSITCPHIAISPSFSVLADVTPGSGIDHSRSPRKHLDTDPIPIHIYLFNNPGLNQGLWAYTHFQSPGILSGKLIAWSIAGVGMVLIGVAVYTFVFRRFQKQRSAAALAGAEIDGNINSLGTESIMIDASSAFGDDDGGYRQLG